MNELAQTLIGDSYAAQPAHILEGLSDELAHKRIPNTPHTIYEELWHIAFWQQVTLDWVQGIETPFPAKPSDGFPSESEAASEPWDQLRLRFLQTAEEAAASARDTRRLDEPIRCPSRPGSPVRIMSVRDQLISLTSHNAYHLGRIVLLRQLNQTWPPASGGYTW
ncbi:MAG TPA: DinB family protein [Edaphobacter sp.]|uniref:DinB family protein n=1 Tax=Edaphobacter sp. TaxID=1934404 RepID=UPI002BCABB48|nr:DinB family protein [Edaphobacter sp.]HUZ94189.1 DinB family protein [Edaphobacter sp.]